MKRLPLSFLLILIMHMPGIWAQKDISLNGEWTLQIPGKDPCQVTVPHTYNTMPGYEDYAGKAYYRRILPITPDMRHMMTRVCFNAVYHDAIVYVNGNKVGEHLNAGYTPFSFDITPYLDFNAENELLVECDNSYSQENIPWNRSFDWANDGGIYRDVKMHVSGNRAIRYVHVTPDVNLKDSTAAAQFDIRLHENRGISLPKKLRTEISIEENSTGRKVFETRQDICREPDGIYRFKADCGRIRLWHFDNPELYTFHVIIFDGKDISDERTERFGFRTFTLEGKNFLLNGEPVRLPGIEDMPGSNPDFGMAEPHGHMAKSVSLMKELNTTITRFHWVQDGYRLQLMDSIGILVQEEISWWQAPSPGLSASLMETAKKQISEMIEAHYNHPCIFAWGMSNEVGGDNRDDLRQMASHARSLDDTRIIDAMCNRIWKHMANDQSLVLDLPTWNEYIGTWHADDRSQLSGFLDSIGEILDGRPLFITENGLCEPAFAGQDTRRVADMLYHINEWKRHPWICGYIYFCLEDYRTQMGEEGYGRNRIRRHGVTDKWLRPKSSFGILRQIMCPLEVTRIKPYGQKEKRGTLAALYDVDELNHSAEISFRVKDDIPSYTLRGYSICFKDKDGCDRELPLPDLSPGKEHTQFLENINGSFNFCIRRPDGTVILNY